MHIITGKYKGRKIPVAKNWTGRPTTGKAREALFSYLQAHYKIEESRVLDLFTGTGSIALEFCSRGAKMVKAVDNFSPTLRQVEKIANTWQILNLTTIRHDALKFLQRQAEVPFNIIFADPPYSWQNKAELIATIMKNKWLKQDGIFIFEHYKADSYKDNKHLIESRNYGDIQFSFFAHNVE